MLWALSNQNAGFSTGKPWLPLAPEHLTKSVTAQTADHDSLLHHYRHAVALRNTHPALGLGGHADLKATGDVL